LDLHLVKFLVSFLKPNFWVMYFNCDFLCLILSKPYGLVLLVVLGCDAIGWDISVTWE